MSIPQVAEKSGPQMLQAQDQIEPFATLMVFLRIGWMDYYEGLDAGDEIKGGGAFVEQHGFGAEIYNFKDQDGLVYGFVEPPGRKATMQADDASAKHLKIDRICASSNDGSVSAQSKNRDCRVV